MPELKDALLMLKQQATEEQEQREVIGLRVRGRQAKVEQIERLSREADEAARAALEASAKHAAFRKRPAVDGRVGERVSARINAAACKKGTGSTTHGSPTGGVESHQRAEELERQACQWQTHARSSGKDGYVNKQDYVRLCAMILIKGELGR